MKGFNFPCYCPVGGMVYKSQSHFTNFFLWNSFSLSSVNFVQLYFLAFLHHFNLKTLSRSKPAESGKFEVDRSSISWYQVTGSLCNKHTNVMIQLLYEQFIMISYLWVKKIFKLIELILLRCFDCFIYRSHQLPKKQVYDSDEMSHCFFK